MTENIILAILIVIGLFLFPYYLWFLSASFYSGKMSVLRKYIKTEEDDKQWQRKNEKENLKEQ